MRAASGPDAWRSPSGSWPSASSRCAPRRTSTTAGTPRTAGPPSPGARVLFGGRDVSSWTAAGAPWVAHEWLTEAAMAALHDALGATAVSVAAALIVTMAFGLVALRLRGRGFGRPTRLAAIGPGFAGPLLGANTHGSSLLLPGVLGTAPVPALLGRERRWPEAAVATVLAALVP